MQDNFEPPGSELIMYDPIDWDPMPANLLRIQVYFIEICLKNVIFRTNNFVIGR